MQTTRFLIPHKIEAQLTLSSAQLEIIAKKWIADNGGEFVHVGNGLWIETDPASMAVEFEIEIPAQAVRVAIEYGNWCIAPPVVEVG